MDSEQLMENVKFIMCGDDLWRINADTDEDGKMQVEFDMHGMSKATAKRQLKNIIAINPSAFTLNAIHGYHYGTAIKDMIQDDELSKRVTDKQCLDYNPGRTMIIIAER